MPDASAIVIIATIGKSTLRRAVESVLNQTYKGVRCLVVVDGEEFYDSAADVMYGTSRREYNLFDKWAGRVDVLTLPQNTGANGYRCFRIYGAMPMLVNQDYVLYLDDDNWFDPDHVQNCISACETNQLDWCYAMRNIYKDGEFLCRDECESVGMWPVWYNPNHSHIDTNCYCIRREVAAKIGNLWAQPRFDKDGNIQASADTQLCEALKKTYPKFAMVPKFTVNYELGSWELSPRPEFFMDGNIKFAERFGGRLPWEKAVK